MNRIMTIDSPKKVRKPLGKNQLGTPLISQSQVNGCVPLLADLVRDYYTQLDVQRVIFITVMHGGKTFSADLAKQCALQSCPLPRDPDHKEYYEKFRVIDRYIDFKSYDGEERDTPKFQATDLTKERLLGERLLLIDDICESGNTLVRAKEWIGKKCGYTQANLEDLVKTITFVWKPESFQPVTQPDWYGYQTSMHFLAGYGMDCADGSCRHLPAIFIDDSREAMLAESSWATRFDHAKPQSKPR